MLGRICSPGPNRVKVSENLGTTAVAPVAPVAPAVTSSEYNITYKLSTNLWPNQKSKNCHKPPFLPKTNVLNNTYFEVHNTRAGQAKRVLLILSWFLRMAVLKIQSTYDPRIKMQGRNQQSMVLFSRKLEIFLQLLDNSSSCQNALNHIQPWQYFKQSSASRQIPHGWWIL